MSGYDNIGTYVSGENCLAWETGPDGSLDVWVIAGYAGAKPVSGPRIQIAASDLAFTLQAMQATAGGGS